MSGKVRSVREALDPVLARLRPVRARQTPLREAVGLRLAADVICPEPFPREAVALRRGVAVASLDIAGASLHAPAPLSGEPAAVRAGDAMPPGCDAVIDAAAVWRDGPLRQATESVEPGAHVRRAGHDLAAGAVLGARGDRITPEMALAARFADLAALPTRAPLVRIESVHGPACEWLMARLSGLGVRSAGSDGAADIIIRAETEGEPRLALRPGETGWIALEGGAVVVEVPQRFDGVIGVWCALALPALAVLAGAAMAHEALPLTRKIASSVGVAEIALLRTSDVAAAPLAVGDLTLEAIAGADAFCAIDAGSEGFAAEAVLDVTSLESPFSRSGPAA
jgi:molybdopterin molybdotransferase